MSTLMAVRVPDNLVKLIDAKGKRSAVIVEALELMFTESIPFEHVPSWMDSKRKVEIVDKGDPHFVEVIPSRSTKPACYVPPRFRK